jgi:hypothetical protein
MSIAAAAGATTGAPRGGGAAAAAAAIVAGLPPGIAAIAAATAAAIIAAGSRGGGGGGGGGGAAGGGFAKRVLPLCLQVQIDHFLRDRKERRPGSYTTLGTDHPCGRCYTLDLIDHMRPVCFLGMILYGLVLLLPPGGHRLLIYLVYAAGLLKKPRIDYGAFSCVRYACGFWGWELTNCL